MNKIGIYDLWYDYIKPKFRVKAKLCYLRTDSFIFTQTKDFETRFDSSNYELDRALSKGKNKQVIILKNEELDDKVCCI